MAFGATAAQAAKGDRNRDGIPDRWAKRFKISNKVKQTNRDQDRDYVRNLCEYQASLNPQRKDTDRDGVRDADEDSDGDGFSNAVESQLRRDCGTADDDLVTGEIISFDGKTLTILSEEGFYVINEVVSDAIIVCEAEEGFLGEEPTGDEGGDADCGFEALVPGRFVNEALVEDGDFTEIFVQV